MTESMKRANSLRRLVSQMHRDLETALRLGQQSLFFAEGVNEAEIGQRNPGIYAVALSLQHFYTAVETLFGRVIHEIQGEIPSGGDWHRQLLDEVTLAIKGARPALISQSLREPLDRLRRFRYIVRHGYEYELDWCQILPLVQSLPKIEAQLKEDLQSFELFVLDTIEALESQ